MITKLVIENLGPIERVEVPLGRFTVLVGPNDSGKSTILRALKLLSYIGGAKPIGTSQNDSPFPNDLDFPSLVNRRSPSSSLRLVASGQCARPGANPFKFVYDVELGVSRLSLEIFGESLMVDDQELIPRNAQVIKLMHNTQDAAQLRIRAIPLLPQLLDDGRIDDRQQVCAALAGASFAPLPSTLALPWKGETDATQIDEDGKGLASIVDQVLRSTKRAPRDEIERQLHAFAPFVESLGTRRSGSGTEIVFGIAGDHELPAKRVSNGVLLALAFLALRHTNMRRFFVEEPENGIHPRAMGEVVKVLRATALLPGGQVVATTHSPLLLNFVEAAEALVVTRDEKHGVRVTPMLETAWFKERSEDFDLGELWYNVGERELVVDSKSSEVPSAP
ncbi:MAG: AAA family ATPase [Deltaproteobacteria bacterium]|nr:AAA family ATPase [Deltaproteobacteria bacterium]